FGDSSLQGLQRSMSSIIATGYTHAGGTISAATLGITLNTDGTLAFDTTKFATATAADPKAVEDLLTNGLSGARSKLVDDYTQTGTGVLQVKETSIQSMMTDYDAQIQRIEDAASSLNDRLTKQYTALETTMSQLQSQTSYLTRLGNTGGL